MSKVIQYAVAKDDGEYITKDKEYPFSYTYNGEHFDEIYIVNDRHWKWFYRKDLFKILPPRNFNI